MAADGKSPFTAIVLLIRTYLVPTNADAKEKLSFLSSKKYFAPLRLSVRLCSVVFGVEQCWREVAWRVVTG